MSVDNPRPLGKFMRGLAGFLSVACALTTAVLAWLALSYSFERWAWWVLLEGYMAFVFGFAALRARAPFPFHRRR
jgi:hypothetical protein